jgi:hypothetical protein
MTGKILKQANKRGEGSFETKPFPYKELGMIKYGTGDKEVDVNAQQQGTCSPSKPKPNIAKSSKSHRGEAK